MEFIQLKISNSIRIGKYILLILVCKLCICQASSNSVACVIYTFKRIEHLLCITKAKEIPVAQRVF